MKTEEQKKADEAARAKNPGIIRKRAQQLLNYVLSEGHVPNPDPTDFRRPGVTPEEAEEILARLKKESQNKHETKKK